MNLVGPTESTETSGSASLPSCCPRYRIGAGDSRGGVIFQTSYLRSLAVRCAGLVIALMALELSLLATDDATNTKGAALPAELRPIESASITNLDMVLIRTAAGSNVMRLLPGSLGEHVASNVLLRLRDKSPAVAMNMFASRLNEATNIIRNPDFWLHDLPETTAYSAIRAYGISAGRVPYGVNASLITRRHFLQVKHNMVSIGSPVVYVTRDNVRIVRRVTDWYPVGNCDTNFYRLTNDCFIVQQLNEAVPDEVVPLKLLPDDASRYFGQTPPFVSGHQSKRFGLYENASAPFVAQGGFEVFRPLGGLLPEWNVPVAGGDSGSTSEFIIQGHLVLLVPLSSPILAAVKVLNSRHGTTELPTAIDLSSFSRVR